MSANNEPDDAERLPLLRAAPHGGQQQEAPASGERYGQAPHGGQQQGAPPAGERYGQAPHGGQQQGAPPAGERYGQAPYGGQSPTPADTSGPQSAQQAWNRREFAWTTFDGTTTFNSLPQRHTSGARLQRVLHEKGQELHWVSTQAFRSVLGDVDYDSFLSGLLFPGETPQLAPPHQYLDYVRLVVSDDSGVVFELPKGRCMLTDRRLVFLSSTSFSSNTVAPYGDPKLKASKVGGYSVVSTVEDTRHFSPFPLSAFLTARLQMHSGVQTSSNVGATAPCCGGICFCCCSKTWTPAPTQVSRQNESHENHYRERGMGWFCGAYHPLA